MSKNKHLTNEERSQVEHWLRALRLGKSTSTISREIKKNSVPSNKSAPGRIPNRCIMRRDCHRIHLCEDKPDCNRSRCSACKLCKTVCPDFKEEFCARLVKPPYVCNGCEIEHMCTLRKRYYLHRPAQKAYEDKLIDCRSGFNIEEDELIRMDERRQRASYYTNCGFMLAFLREHNTSQSVIDIFNDLYSILGKDVFRRLFPVILTDNGSEFSNPKALEFADDSSRRTTIFYCEPSSPFQKPHVENNHELLRRILPKGCSFNGLTQSDILLAFKNYPQQKCHRQDLGPVLSRIWILL